MSPETLIYSPDSWFETLSWGRMFGISRPLDVEIGSGDGSFLLEWARTHPEHNYLGVERLLGRLRKLDRKGRRARLENLRLMRIEASYFLQYLLPQSSVTALHIYFPDPWPKRKHRRHRLINDSFPGLAARSLVPLGAVHLRTDDVDYFAQMESVFGASTQFTREPTPEALLAVRTDFEREFQARGIPTQHATYRLGAGPVRKA